MGRKKRIAQGLDQMIIEENIQIKMKEKNWKENKTNVVTYFATRLNEELEIQNKHQKDFCDEIKISEGVLSKYRNGNGIPTCDIAAKIAKGLNVTLDFLVGLTDVKSVDEDFKKVHKITGLSDKSIETLKVLVCESKNDNAPKEYSINTIKTINYLLENDNAYKLLNRISDFLWDKYDVEDYLGAETVELTYSNGEKGIIPASELYDIKILKIQRKLDELKKDIEEKRKGFREKQAKMDNK